MFNPFLPFPLVRSEEWLSQMDEALEGYAHAVVAATWGAAASEVSDVRGLDPASLSVKDRERVKDKFRLFNDSLDAACAALPHWSVPDAELRGVLRGRLHDEVLVPYARLFERFSEAPFTKFKEKYVKVAPDEAERIFQSFFEGLRE